MTGIYEISTPGVCAPTKRPPGCVVLDVSTQTRESFYSHAAMAVTPDVTITPSPAINLDGSDMVRMSWPEGDELSASAMEIARLRRWKNEAMAVMAEWNEVWVALGKPGQIGDSIPAVCKKEAERLRHTEDYFVDLFNKTREFIDQ